MFVYYHVFCVLSCVYVCTAFACLRVCVCVCLCVHACVHACVSACVNLKHLSQHFHTFLFLVSDWHACQQQICGVLQEMTSDSMTQDHSHDMSNHSRSFGISAQFGKRCDVLPLFMQNLYHRHNIRVSCLKHKLQIFNFDPRSGTFDTSSFNMKFAQGSSMENIPAVHFLYVFVALRHISVGTRNWAFGLAVLCWTADDASFFSCSLAFAHGLLWHSSPHSLHL